MGLKFLPTFFYLLFISYPVLGCEIELYSNIFYLNNVDAINQKSIVKESNCPVSINELIVNQVKQSALTSSIVNIAKIQANAIADNSRLTSSIVHILPREIFIKSLNQVLKEQLKLDQSYDFFDLKLNNSDKSLSLDDNFSIDSTCDYCQSSGDKNVKINITQSDGTVIKTIWLNSKLKVKVKTFKLSKNINFNQEHFLKSDFIESYDYFTNIDQILTNLEGIEFYKPNKTLLSGHTITKFDLNPAQLIQSGASIKASINLQGLEISKNFTAKRNAQYGEIIELQSNNGKIIRGKVINFNQVVIE